MEAGGVMKGRRTARNRLPPYVWEFKLKFDKISEGALQVLVDRFYGKVRSDPVIGPVFNGAISDWPGHLEKLQAFWSSVMLTSGRYKGRPLPAHVKHSDAIDDAAFGRWLELWAETTDELFDRALAEALQAKAARIAESLSMGIAFSRDPQAALGVAKSAAA